MNPQSRIFYHIPSILGACVGLAVIVELIVDRQWWFAVVAFPMMLLYVMVRRCEQYAFMAGWRAATSRADLILEGQVDPELGVSVTRQLMLERPNYVEHQRAMARMHAELGRVDARDHLQEAVNIIRRYR